MKMHDRTISLRPPDVITMEWRPDDESDARPVRVIVEWGNLMGALAERNREIESHLCRQLIASGRQGGTLMPIDHVLAAVSVIMSATSECDPGE